MNNDGSGWKLKLKEDINFLCVSHLILIPALFFNSMLLKFSFHLQRAFWRGTCLNFLSTKDVDCHHDIWHYLLFCNIQIWKGRQKSVENCLIIFFYCNKFQMPYFYGSVFAHLFHSRRLFINEVFYVPNNPKWS